jgi:hypothetical protein
MKNLLNALLLAGLFISAQAVQVGGTDYTAGSYAPSTQVFTKCKTTYSYKTNSINEEWTTPGDVPSSVCAEQAKNKFGATVLGWHNAGLACPLKVISEYPTYYYVQPMYLYTPASGGASSCKTTGNAYSLGIGAVKGPLVNEQVCPPPSTGSATEIAARQQYTILGKQRDANGNETSTLVCYKPLPPLDCSKLSGMSTSGTDYFITNTAGYTHPSCVTKCGTDANGQKQCGNCKVIAKSWVQNTLGYNVKKWTPLIGTLTGAACADNEQDVPPPEPPKCWVSKNGLKMCQQDPAEKCVNVNGVQQCEAGCGYVNGDFFCQDKAGTEPPKRNDDDNPLPEVDDTITDPNKSINDMVKDDFKEVNKGVESRLAVVSTGIGNLENSVDTSNQILEKIEQNTENALSDNQTEIGLLSDIKEALTGEGGGDGEGECDPEKSPTCGTGGDAGAPASWWTSVYPDGITGIIDAKKAQFQSTPAYESMTQEINIGSGTVQPWQFCFNASSMNFGCFDVEIPPYVLQFVRLCILFGAAILCRRLLIGA